MQPVRWVVYRAESRENALVFNPVRLLLTFRIPVITGGHLTQSEQPDTSVTALSVVSDLSTMEYCQMLRHVGCAWAS